MRLPYLAIVLALALVGCAKKQQAPDAKKPVPPATTPSDPQPVTAPAEAPAPAPAAAAPAPGSRSPVKKGGDPEDGGQ